MRIADSHNDFLTEFKTKKDILKYLDYLNNSDVKLLSCAVWTSELKYHPQRALKRLRGCLNAFKGSCRLLFSVEDSGFIASRAPVLHSAPLNNSPLWRGACEAGGVVLKKIQTIVILHPISCSLTWNNDNALAGGNYGKGSVTKLGREVIKTFEQNNIFIDTAHLNRKSFYEFCRLTKKPIYNSHCALDAVNPHKRNLTDRQIKKVIESNGYIGLCLVGEFLKSYAPASLGCHKITARTVALHFDYFIKHFGYKNIGWGTDFNGTKDLPQNIKNYEDLALVADELRKLGYNDEVIDCLFYKNYYDFLERNKLL